jgi:hypothetical protein
MLTICGWSIQLSPVGGASTASKVREGTGTHIKVRLIRKNKPHLGGHGRLEFPITGDLCNLPVSGEAVNSRAAGDFTSGRDN